MKDRKLNDGKNGGRDSNPKRWRPGRDLNPGRAGDSRLY